MLFLMTFSCCRMFSLCRSSGSFIQSKKKKKSLFAMSKSFQILPFWEKKKKSVAVALTIWHHPLGFCFRGNDLSSAFFTASNPFIFNRTHSVLYFCCTSTYQHSALQMCSFLKHQQFQIRRAGLEDRYFSDLYACYPSVTLKARNSVTVPNTYSLRKRLHVVVIAFIILYCKFSLSTSLQGSVHLIMQAFYKAVMHYS